MKPLYATRDLSQAIGLETTLDKILFSISVVLTVILFGIIIWFWRQRKESPKVHIFGDSPDDARQSSKKDSKYPTITIVQKPESDQSSVAESEVSSMWDSQSQKYDISYFTETQMKKDIENYLSSSREHGNAHSVESDVDSFTPGNGSTRSTVERVDQSTYPRKMLQRDYHIYSKSNIEACESRDEEYGGARSI
jgi:hypothetical protein